MTAQKLSYTYNPISLTKMLLQMYIEQEIEGKTFKSRQYALYEYMHSFTDEECESIVNTYAKQENLKEITFNDWKKDCSIMLYIIEQTKRYNKILKRVRLSAVKKYNFEENKGISGILMPNGEFLQCGYQEHSLIAEEMEWVEQINSVYFSSPLQFGEDVNSSGIVTISPLRNNTDKNINKIQNQWILEHIKYLDSEQKYHADFILIKLKEL